MGLKSLVVAAMALLAAPAQAETMAETIAFIKALIEKQESQLAPLRKPLAEPDNTGARLISTQFPTTFGDLMEVPSSDGSRFLTLDGDNLAIRAKGSNQLRQLTGDGTALKTWRATEEASQSFPAQWSPDGKYIAATRLDLTQVHHEPLLRTLMTPPVVERVPYPRAGEPMQGFDLFFLNADTGARTPMQLGNTADHYVTIEGWRGDGQAVLVQVIDRAHKHLRFFSVDAKTGSAALLIEEKTDTYFDTVMTLGTPLVYPVPDSRDVLYLSERSSRRHLYRVSPDGSQKALTGGKWPVQKVVAIADGAAFVLATQDQSQRYARQLLQVDIKTGDTKTLQSCPGFLEAASNNEGLVTRCASPATAPYTQQISFAGEASKKSPVFPDGFPFEDKMDTFVTPSTDGEWPMHGVIIKPGGFDPAKSYPVVEVIYGGMQWDFFPQGAFGMGTLASGYNGFIPRILAARGHVVVMMSAPGTPGRGKAFQDATYGTWPQGVMGNHAKWIRDAAAARPWMDLGRVGIFGNSWGGYMAQRAMIDAPDLYAVAVAMAAPSDFIDHPTYIEPFMGLPKDNPAGYAAGSNLERVNAIQGPILVMPMPLDANAGYSPGMKFVRAMMAAGKDVDLFSIPGVNHRITCCGQEIEHYAYAKIVRYLEDHLAQGAP